MENTCSYKSMPVAISRIKKHSSQQNDFFSMHCDLNDQHLQQWTFAQLKSSTKLFWMFKPKGLNQKWPNFELLDSNFRIAANFQKNVPLQKNWRNDCLWDGWPLISSDWNRRRRCCRSHRRHRRHRRCHHLVKIEKKMAVPSFFHSCKIILQSWVQFFSFYIAQPCLKDTFKGLKVQKNVQVLCEGVITQ